MDNNIKELTFYCESLSREISIKDYLKQLLLKLWDEQEEFSGKRPFGDGDWDYDIMVCLVQHEVIEGVIDKDGYVVECDYNAGKTIVRQIIESL